MRTKQSGPVQSEFYTFSPAWSGLKNIHNQLLLLMAGTVAENCT